MISKFYSKENLQFILFKVHKVNELCQLEYFKDHNEETFQMILESAHTLSEKHLYPIHLEMDDDEPKLVDGIVKVHPNMKYLMKQFGEQGWISANFTYEEGGQQLPSMVCWASSFIMGAANYSAVVYPGLTMGASELIRLFGTSQQKATYLAKMFEGKWQGTMALTEPEAGSSLSDIVTTAYPTDKGYYLIRGQKIFISCGDHDATENIVHMMLARIKDAPKGAKGISLFIVPKKRLNSDGSLIHNDVTTAGIYHKLGYRGAPIAHLMMGEKENCHGYLVGEENMGLKYMFKMMNGARISVGMHSISIASAAYYGSLQYSRERKQGRIISDKDVSKPQVPIIEHADVKRMLLFQKSIIEGSLSLLLQCSKYEDLSYHGHESEKSNYALLLDLLTPIAKSYPAEMGILTTSAALQIHGGYGYTKDFAAEKYFREIRIHTLHEGTTAMHGLDLLGRKVMMKNGQAVILLMQEVIQDITTAKSSDTLKVYAEKLEKKMIVLQEVTMKLVGVAQKVGIEAYLADATLYLELFSILTIGWQWIKMANTAEQEMKNADESYLPFLKSQINTMIYFFEYELPKTNGLVERLKSDNHLTATINESIII